MVAPTFMMSAVTAMMAIVDNDLPTISPESLNMPQTANMLISAKKIALNTITQTVTFSTALIALIGSSEGAD